MSHPSDFEIVRSEDQNAVTEQSGGGAAMEVATSRAASEVQSAMIIAKKFPRDETKAFARIMQSCRRKSLADAAIYSYPKGGSTIEGPSIRLAEEMARQWGNIDFGIIELEQRNGESTCMSYAWDLETNTRQTKIFTVRHERVSGSGANKRKTVLDDPRDIYEMVANQGARRLRACILGIIPGDICEEAVTECNKTMAGPDSTPLIDRARKMVSVFSDFGVTIQMIEKRLGHKIDATSETELGTLRKIYKSIADGMATREAHFDLGEQTKRPDAPAKAATGVAAATAPVATPAPQTATATTPAAEPPPTAATITPTELVDDKAAAKKRATPPKPAADAKPPAPEAPQAPEAPPEVPAPKTEDKKKEPRTTLEDKEIFACTVVAEDISAMLIGGKPGLKIEVGGEFRGIIYHVGAAKADPQNPDSFLVDPIWQLDRPTRVELVGAKQRAGGTLGFVQKVSPMGGNA